MSSSSSDTKLASSSEASLPEKTWRVLMRTKHIDEEKVLETPLKRCISTIDLILFGVGNMMGSGIYILTGSIMRNKSGPATFVSYLLGGIAAIFSCLCYAELASRIPKAGSAYTYTYVTAGEFLAFVIGWSVILEYVLSAAAVARGWSATLDSMIGGAIKNGTMTYIGTLPVPPNSFFSQYLDFVAVAILLVIIAIIVSGARISVTVNTFATGINLLVIAFFVVVMFFGLNSSYITGAGCPNGTFAPYGAAGVISGAATGFFSYIGFDAMTIAGEEVERPASMIPIASGIAITVVASVLTIASLTLAFFQPYCLVDSAAPFTSAFYAHGMAWAGIITGVGAIIGITACLLCTVYALPRVAYAMGSDGLIFKFLGFVYQETRTPVWSILTFGLLSAVFALFFALDTLADFLSIGTLIAYTIVTANTVALRFMRPTTFRRSETASQITPLLADGGTSTTTPQPASKISPSPVNGYGTSSLNAYPPIVSTTNGEGDAYETTSMRSESTNDMLTISQTQAGIPGTLKPSVVNIIYKVECLRPLLRGILRTPPAVVPIISLIFFIVFTSACLGTLFGYLSYGNPQTFSDVPWWIFILIAVFAVAMLSSLLLMCLFEQDQSIQTFKVPLVPLFPCLGIVVNIILILHLSPLTWLRFFIWLALGLIIYFAYGIWSSEEAHYSNGYFEGSPAPETETVPKATTTQRIYPTEPFADLATPGQTQSAASQ